MEERTETAYLPTVFLAPGKDPSLPIATTHKEFNFFGTHAFRFLTIWHNHRVLEVNTMLVEQMQSLLLII